MYGKHLGRARQKLIDMDRPSNSAQPTNAEVKDPGHPSRNSSSRINYVTDYINNTTKQGRPRVRNTSGGQKLICAIAVCWFNVRCMTSILMLKRTVKLQQYLL